MGSSSEDLRQDGQYWVVNTNRVKTVKDTQMVYPIKRGGKVKFLQSSLMTQLQNIRQYMESVDFIYKAAKGEKYRQKAGSVSSPE